MNKSMKGIKINIRCMQLKKKRGIKLMQQIIIEMSN